MSYDKSDETLMNEEWEREMSPIINRPSIMINRANIIAHVADCTFCTKGNVAPNGFSRTGDNEMKCRIVDNHMKSAK